MSGATGPLEALPERRDTWTEWAVTSPACDSFFFTSRNRLDAEEWAERLRKSGHDVVLASAEYERVSHLRRSRWQTVAKGSQTGGPDA